MTAVVSRHACCGACGLSYSQVKASKFAKSDLKVCASPENKFIARKAPDTGIGLFGSEQDFAI
jgi:hypothetical protein